MYCEHLSLTNFRTYSRLELALPSGISLFSGANASGKTSLLEALFLLATTKSHRTNNDRELMDWSAERQLGAPPFSRVEAVVDRSNGRVDLELVLTKEIGAGNGAAEPVRKRIKVNHAPKRAVDLIGEVNAVMFSPQDTDIIGGPPTLRRRYLDITLCQIDPRYVRVLQQYRKVVLQRNHLLRRAKEKRQSSALAGLRDELTFWNDELVRAGSYVVLRRVQVISALGELAQRYHQQLTGASEELRLVYEPSFALSDLVPSDPSEPLAASAIQQVQERFRQALEGLAAREITLGLSLLGPHRDDLKFLVDGVDLGVYGSRGQQRTVTLALKLAEVDLMSRETGETPILMLDDLLSELDPLRREYLLRTLTEREQQVLVTTTDPASFSEEFLGRASIFEVQRGEVKGLGVKGYGLGVRMASLN